MRGETTTIRKDRIDGPIRSRTDKEKEAEGTKIENAEAAGARTTRPGTADRPEIGTEEADRKTGKIRSGGTGTRTEIRARNAIIGRDEKTGKR